MLFFNLPRQLILLFHQNGAFDLDSRMLQPQPGILLNQNISQSQHTVYQLQELVLSNQEMQRTKLSNTRLIEAKLF